MNALWTYSEWLERLAGSLLHFVWQGALIAFIAAILLRLLARRSAVSRYTVAVVGLGLMLLAPCITFIFYPETGGAALRVLQFLSRSAAEAGKSASAGGVALWTTWIVLAWAAGVSICGIRLMMGWILFRGLIRSARVAIPANVGQLMERVRTQVVGSRQVRLLVGETIDTPVVFGWLRPVVVLPVIAIRLSENLLLAVMAHELAHIRRHDFLVNALQRGVESVLFYHPAVWWLSSRIRTEREHCCDDLAVQVCGDQFVYAEALIELERTRATVPALAIPAAAGRLGGRIRRVLGVSSVNRDWQPAVAALLLVAMCALAGSWQNETIAATSLMMPPPEASPAVPGSPLKAIAAIVTSQTPRTVTPSVPQLPAQTESPEITPARAAARKELGQLLVPYSAESFVRQAEEGDSIAVRLFLAAGMNPNVIATLKYGDSTILSTALVRAARAGQTETVKVLIAGHADVNFSTGQPAPLAAAASGGNAEMVKALLTAGAGVDSKSGDRTPLMLAAESGRTDVIKALLENGADIRAKGNDGSTAVILAASSGNVNAIQTLLDAGASVNETKNDGTTPLLAANLTKPESIKLLLDKNADVNARDNRGVSSLMRVFLPYVVFPSITDSLRMEYVKMYLLRGADSNLGDNEGTTPLMVAAQRGDIEAVKALLDKGADANAKARSGNTALKAAEKRPDIVQLLLNSGAKQ